MIPTSSVNAAVEGLLETATPEEVSLLLLSTLRCLAKCTTSIDTAAPDRLITDALRLAFRTLSEIQTAIIKYPGSQW